jgi:hypothetical protein
MDLRTTRTVRSAIEIRAPIEVVWQTLTDFRSYPEWNPLIRQLRGKPREGGRVTLRSQPPGGRSMVFRAKVLSWQPPRELRWRSTFISGRLFSGEHGFRLDELPGARVRFVQDETIRGLAVPLYSRLRMAATRRGFQQLNEALRDRAERIAGQAAG